MLSVERDLEPEIKAMIRRAINRTVMVIRNDQEEALKVFYRQACLLRKHLTEDFYKKWER